MFRDPDHVKTAYSNSFLYVESAADHVVGFTKTKTPPVQTVASWTMARGVVEASGAGRLGARIVPRREGEGGAELRLKVRRHRGGEEALRCPR